MSESRQAGDRTRCSSHQSTKLVVVIVALLAAFTLVKGVAWTIIVPLGQHPDETTHQIKVDHIARAGNARSAVQWSSKALDVTTSATYISELKGRNWIRPPFDNQAGIRYDKAMQDTRVLRNSPGGIEQELAYPPLYYGVTAGVMRATGGARYDLSWFTERIFSVILATLTISIQFLFLRRIFSGDAIKAGFAAFALTAMPLYTAMESAVNPEVLIVFLVSVALVLTQHIYERPKSIPLHLLFWAVFIAGIQTKSNGAVVLAPYGVALIAHTKKPKIWGVCAAAITLIALGIQVAMSSPPLSAVLDRSFRVLNDFNHRNINLYWSYFGWHDAVVSPWVLDVFGFLSVGAAAIFVYLVARREASVYIVMAASAIVLSFAGIVQLELVSDTGFGQGRYYFGVVAGIIAIQFWVLDKLTEGRRILRWTMWPAALLVVIALHVNSFAGVVIPRYFL